jgi:large subunit ribosomal protein L23
MKQVLISPIITEKSLNKTAESVYTFKVAKSANKNIIKKAIEEFFKVKVERVNILNVPSKIRRRGRIIGKKSGFKKAIVQLKKGQKIELFEQAQK